MDQCNCLEKAAAHMGVQDVPMNVAYKERPQQSARSSPVLPDSRVSSVPGHDRSSVPPTIRPLPTVSTGKTFKVTINNSPGHDPSTSSSGVLPSVKATVKRTSGVPGHNPQFSVSAFSIAKQAGKTFGVQSDQAVDAKRNSSGVRGHDPQYNASAYLTHVKEAGKSVLASGQNVSRQATSASQPVRATNSRVVSQSNLRGAAAGLPAVKTADKAPGSVGQGVSRQSPSVPQSVNATNRRAIGQSNLRWRVVGFSPTTAAGVSSSVPENTNTRQTTPSSSTSNSSATRCSYLDVRRPRDKMFTHIVDNSVSSTTPVSSRAQSSSILATIGQKSVSQGGLATNNSPRSTAFFQKRSDILSSRARAQVEISPQDRCSSVSSGQNSLVRSISTQLGGLFSSTVSAIAGIGLSSLSFASWSEQSVGKCISLLGSQLMSARKILQSSLI
ncbi:hypothetical protein PENSUB_410 [Penicillium subrubescens]|uniref:Uncharacterized protein n=1 Tax=Penicillium subrubescens TaxID=1316194 RepID=A0A1Q5UMW6_9EURO|nr:hypothetical protein PENSUB_410 [Penicillium subrubescens]